MGYSDPAKQREYGREWLARRRYEFLADKFCATCGSTTDLEVDHIDRLAKIDHKVWSWSTERRTAELAKCQVLCHKCHLAKTARERRNHGVHGTSGMYDHGCRCRICKDYGAERKRLWRRRTGRN